MIFKSLISAFTTSWKGMTLTFRHLVDARKSNKNNKGIKSANYFDQQNGIVTIQYPHEKLPVPEVGRYQLDVEIDDCIVCDLCAKICPVDCITIESIKATEAIGQTSDGTVKRLYAAKFDIDMGQCCYCGLCTIVCPTECITMTNQYDRSVYTIGDLTYQFSDMAPEVAQEKRELLQKQIAEKQALKDAALKAKEQPK